MLFKPSTALSDLYIILIYRACMADILPKSTDKQCQGLGWGGGHSTMDSILASNLTVPGSNPSIPKKFSQEILKMVRLINGNAWNSGQRFDNDD